MGVSGQPFFTAALHPRPSLNALKNLEKSALCRESYHDVRFRRQPALSLSQGWRTYGTRPQNVTRRGPFGTQHSMLSQLFLFILYNKRLYVVKYMCVYT
jgi:hypothetical protein